MACRCGNEDCPRDYHPGRYYPGIDHGNTGGSVNDGKPAERDEQGAPDRQEPDGSSNVDRR